MLINPPFFCSSAQFSVSLSLSLSMYVCIFMLVIFANEQKESELNTLQRRFSWIFIDLFVGSIEYVLLLLLFLCFYRFRSIHRNQTIPESLKYSPMWLILFTPTKIISCKRKDNFNDSDYNSVKNFMYLFMRVSWSYQLDTQISIFFIQFPWALESPCKQTKLII